MSIQKDEVKENLYDTIEELRAQLAAFKEENKAIKEKNKELIHTHKELKGEVAKERNKSIQIARRKKEIEAELVSYKNAMDHIGMNNDNLKAIIYNQQQQINRIKSLVMLNKLKYIKYERFNIS